MRFADACEKACRPIVEAYHKLPHAPMEGAFLKLSERLLKLSREFVRDFMRGRHLPPLKSFQKPLQEGVRATLWNWANELSPSLTYSVRDKTSPLFRLIKQCEQKIDRAVLETLAAIYAGVDSPPKAKKKLNQIAGALGRVDSAGDYHQQAQGLARRSGHQTPSRAAARSAGSLAPLHYPKSAVRRAIVVILTNNPHASDRQICLQLDDDGIDVFSSRLKTKVRSFQEIYEGKDKHKIEGVIADVRADMRKHGLL
jgi:hypothetical protein